MSNFYFFTCNLHTASFLSHLLWPDADPDCMHSVNKREGEKGTRAMERKKKAENPCQKQIYL